MMKKILMLLPLLLVFLNSYADDDVISQINKIKKNSQYLYGESTMPTEHEASQVAMEMLQEDINQWAVSHAKKKVEKVVATDVSHLVDSIITTRVNMYRVFLYVKKSKLIPIYKQEGLVIVDPEAKDNKKDKEKTDVESKKTVAKIETPKDSVKEPLTVDLSSYVSQDNTESGVQATQAMATVSNTSQTLSDQSQSALEKIKALKTFDQLQPTIMPLAEEGTITEYGKYATLTDPEEAYLIIYDPEGRIRAVFGKGDSIRKNLVTGKDDSIKNYHGCGAIWFKLK